MTRAFGLMALQVRLLIEWRSRIPFKLHTSSTPREGLPGSQAASENKSFVSSPPHDSWVLLLWLQLQPLWCRWEIQGEVCKVLRDTLLLVVEQGRQQARQWWRLGFGSNYSWFSCIRVGSFGNRKWVGFRMPCCRKFHMIALFLLTILWCSSQHSDHPEINLAKFGYIIGGGGDVITLTKQTSLSTSLTCFYLSSSRRHSSALL